VSLRAGWAHKIQFSFSFDMTNMFLENQPTQIVLDRGVVDGSSVTWTYGVELSESIMSDDV
jgi:hypothetical protein